MDWVEVIRLHAPAKVHHFLMVMVAFSFDGQMAGANFLCLAPSFNAEVLSVRAKL